jgi:ABC-type multidrug transport system permease subunit
MAVNNNETEPDAAVLQLLSENVSEENIIKVGSDEEGFDLLKCGKVSFFISIDASTNPPKAVFYYDSSSMTGAAVKKRFENIQNEYAYETLAEFLKSKGIILNDNYFHLIEFKSYDGNNISSNQIMFVNETGAFLSIILLFGMIFSIARDNETGVYRQAAYTPIGINKYLLSKALPYLALGIIQSAVMILLGAYYFDISYKANAFIIFLFMFMFVYCTVFLGLLISQSRYQIITAFVSMVIILLPVFALFVNGIDGYSPFIELILYCFPLTSYLSLIKYIIFNGVINVVSIVILLLQSAVFYFSAAAVLKKRVSK